MSGRRTLRDALRVALAFAVWFGLVEGGIRLFTRQLPRLHAAHKVSIDVLWVAPLLDLALFALVASLLHGVARWGPSALREREVALTRGVLAGIGFATLCIATDVLHPASIAVLSLGAGWAVARRPSARPPSVIGPAAALLAAVIGSTLWPAITERIETAGLPEPPGDAPNVLVLMLDTVRWDSFRGGPGATLAPNLTDLAASCVTFEQAWSVTSWSLPSQASVLTGVHPFDHGADWPTLTLEEDLPTLAEHFRDRGYATGAFSGNSSWITPEYLGRGFLRFRVYVLEDLVRRTSLGKGLDGLGRALGMFAAGRGKKAPRIRRELEGFLDAHDDRPFFAYLCYMDVNQSIYARLLNHYFRRRAPYPEVFEAYEEGLATLDARIGEMLDDLRDRGALENTLVVVVSDHGESFGPEVRDDRLPRGHGTSLYPEQTRIPLFIAGPGLPSATTIDEPVGLAGLYATILELAGRSSGAESDHAVPPLPGLGLPEALPPEPLMTLRYEDRDWRAIASREWEWVETDSIEGRGALIALPPADTSPVGGDRARIELPDRLHRLLERGDPGTG